MTKDFIKQSERASIHILPADDVIARAEQFHDGIETPHSARKRESVTTAFQRRDVPLQGFSRGVFPPSVLVSLVVAESVLDVRRREVDRRHDGAREGLRSLSSVNSAGRDTARNVFVKNARHGLRLVGAEGEGSPRGVESRPPREPRPAA